MYGGLFLSTLCVAALAAPLTQITESRAYVTSTWQPVQGSKSSCDKSSGKIIGFYVGPQMEDVLTNACAAMMPACAYPSRLPNDTVCAQVVDWRLDGPKSSTQSANVETAEGNKISGWDVKCRLNPMFPVFQIDADRNSVSDSCSAARDFSRCLLDGARLLWVLRVHVREMGASRLPHPARLWHWEHHGWRG